MATIKQVNKFILNLFVLQIFVSVLYNISFKKENVTIVISCCLQLLVLFLSILLFFIKTKTKPLTIIQINYTNMYEIACAIILALVIQPVMYCLYMIGEVIFGKANNICNEYLQSLPIAILILALLPALLEEIIFRGIILNAYKDEIPNIKYVIITNGILFALMHINFQQILYTFIMGSLLALIVYYNNSILLAFIIHFVFNLTQVVLAYSYSKCSYTLLLISNYIKCKLTFVVCIVLGCLYVSIKMIFALIKNKYPYDKCHNIDTSSFNLKKIFTKHLLLYLLLTTIIMIFASKK